MLAAYDLMISHYCCLSRLSHLVLAAYSCIVIISTGSISMLVYTNISRQQRESSLSNTTTMTESSIHTFTTGVTSLSSLSTSTSISAAEDDADCFLPPLPLPPRPPRVPLPPLCIVYCIVL